MNKKQFLLCKKLFGRINHHQLLNEHVLHNFFLFLSVCFIVFNRSGQLIMFDKKAKKNDDEFIDYNWNLFQYSFE